MIYILAGITASVLLIAAAELLVRAADRTGIMDKLFSVFDLPTETKVICVDFNEDERRKRHG